MAIWIRPSGTEIETNDSPETIEYCESLGWKRKTVRKTKKKEKTEES